MACCRNPNIKSSTFSDWCVNCGWQYNYTDNTEIGSSRAYLTKEEQEKEDREDSEYRY